MLSVKIEFYSLDWYSSSPIAIVLYKRMYLCKMFPSNRQKLKKRKCDLLEISSASPKGPFPLRAWKKAFFVCFIAFFLRSLQF